MPVCSVCFWVCVIPSQLSFPVVEVSGEQAADVVYESVCLAQQRIGAVDG